LVFTFTNQEHDVAVGLKKHSGLHTKNNYCR